MQEWGVVELFSSLCMLCTQWWDGPKDSETNSTNNPPTHFKPLSSLDYCFFRCCRCLWRIERLCKEHLPTSVKLVLFIISSVSGVSFAGVMPLWSRSSWFLMFGAALVVLTAGNVGPNQDKRQAGSSQCFGGFDLYFVLDKWVTWHTLRGWMITRFLLISESH